MDMTITGRNITLNDHLKDYIHKRLDKVEKLYSRIYKCEVILDEERERKNVEVILYLKRNRIVAKETTPDIYASIDNAAMSLKKQLRRLHGKVQSKRRKNIFAKIVGRVPGFRQTEPVEEDVMFDIPRGEIVKVRAFADKPMLPEEARMEMDVMNRTFLMFKNADTGEVNVIYKKGDGNFGLIEPGF
ncbi:MAG: ribosome-associated translation inhibitor RaiA [Candidatus Omnitrophica bacterium]|jgi:putative sigma-54 modulation protein|nr:ribosome-associated translation inhibitor RaiA [Candidatus Omnitrophota bacterium]